MLRSKVNNSKRKAWKNVMLGIYVLPSEFIYFLFEVKDYLRSIDVNVRQLIAPNKKTWMNFVL